MLPPPPPPSPFFGPESPCPASLPASGGALPGLHLCDFGSQTGLSAGQSELVSHSTHEPFEHAVPAAFPAQSLLLLHGSQLPDDPQNGDGFWHCESLVQMHLWSGPHVSEPQSRFPTHWTQAPLAVSHTSGEQSESAWHGPQVSDMLQTGLSPEQVELSTHPTHL
jgi:hypothetical protein